MKSTKQLEFSDERQTQDVEQIHENRTPIALLLDGLEDMINIGSIFRLSDALRLQKIFFYHNKVNLSHKKLTKVARSTNKYTDYKEVNLEQIIELQNEYEIVVIDKTNKSIDYKTYKKKTEKPLLFVLGNEKHGVSDDILNLTTNSIHLPMLGVNTSMNVAMAGGIVLYHFLE